MKQLVLNAGRTTTGKLYQVMLVGLVLFIVSSIVDIVSLFLVSRILFFLGFVLMGVSLLGLGWLRLTDKVQPLSLAQQWFGKTTRTSRVVNQVFGCICLVSGLMALISAGMVGLVILDRVVK